MPGSPDWAGTALLHGATPVFSQQLAIPAGGQVIQYLQFTKPGYLINAAPQYSGASGANPYCQVHWIWVDADPAVNALGEQSWTMKTTTGAVFCPVFGSGPVRGPWAQVMLTNLDGVQPVKFNLTVWETTQHIARDDWRDSELFGFQPPAGIAAAPGAHPSLNELCSAVLSSVTSSIYALPLYAGQAWLSFQVTPAASGTANLSIQPANRSGFVLQPVSIVAATVQNAQAVTMPREPCSLVLAGSGTGATMNIALTVMEYAS